MSLTTMADMMQRITELEGQLAEAKDRIKLLELCLKDMERDYRTELRQNMFASQVLSGEFDPPTIAEIRKARGLEPL